MAKNNLNVTICIQLIEAKKRINKNETRKINSNIHNPKKKKMWLDAH